MRMAGLAFGIVFVASVAAQETSSPPRTAEAGSSSAGAAGVDVGQGASAARVRPLHEHPTLLQMLFRNNQLRRSRGLWSHRIHPALTRAAQDHAEYMARTHDFNHYSNLGPSGRAYKHGFRGGVMENIAMGYGDVATTFSGWQSSSGHWANLTSHTTDAGFGYAVSRNGTPYWVAVYGNAPAASASDVNPATATGPAVPETDRSHVARDTSAPSQDSAATAATDGGHVTPASSPPQRVYSTSSSAGRVRIFRRRR